MRRGPLVLLSFVICFSLNAFAQGGRVLFAEPLKVLDKAFYEVAYQYNSEDPHTDPAKPLTRTAEMALLIGEKNSQYSDYKSVVYDSLCNLYAGKYMNPMESLMLLRNHNASPGNFYIIRSHDRLDSIMVMNKITTVSDPMDRNGFVVYNAVYSEPAPAIDWTILDEKKTIGGIEVTKATGRLHGRDWTAWFAESVPYPEGPWELVGLPGLILEAYDSDNQHEFSLIHLKPVDRNIFDRSGEYEKTSREAFLKYRNDRYQADRSGWKTKNWPSVAPFGNFIEKD